MDIIIEPGKVITWKDFCKTAQPYSIALDGFVSCGPKFDHKGPFVNFNHHEDVSRLETRATCSQVLIAIRQGLFATFRRNGKPFCLIYVNDCDQDVCLSVFLLEHHFLVTSTMNPLINQLVFMEDMLDTTAGAYAFPIDLPSLQKVMWVFEPYTAFRSQGGLSKGNSDDFKKVIDEVGTRIMAFYVGNSKFVELDTRYEKIGGGKGWIMVKEIGQHARAAMFNDNITAFVSVRELPNGRYAYVYGKTSQYIQFPIDKIIQTANALENCPPDDAHGGSDIVGGSPRKSGSKLTPDELTKMINDLL